MTAQEIGGRGRALDTSSDRSVDFRALYETWFDEVCRWLRALGGPQSDVEDLAQEVFIVARRKLSDFDGRSPAGWLYRISANTVSDARRRAWFKHLFLRRASAPLDNLPLEGEGPDGTLARREAERVVYAILDQMSEKRRRAIILSELEGYDSADIAQLEGIPVATVRTRLHHARREFTERAEKLRRREAR
jgi:RNA polymerase sigma-70 factor (ECF subfamily)